MKHLTRVICLGCKQLVHEGLPPGTEMGLNVKSQWSKGVLFPDLVRPSHFNQFVISINLYELSGSKSCQSFYMDLVGPSQFNQFIWTSWVQVGFEELKSHYRYQTHYETSYSCDLPGLQAARPRRTPPRPELDMNVKSQWSKGVLFPDLVRPSHFNEFIWT